MVPEPASLQTLLPYSVSDPYFSSQWHRDRLRTEIRDTMAAEAVAAHVESDQLALANKHDMDYNKAFSAAKGLDEQYEALVKQEKSQLQKHRDELYELKDTFQVQVSAMYDQTLRARERAKDLHKNANETEALILTKRHEAEQEENYLKQQKEETGNERHMFDQTANAVKVRIRDDALVAQSEYHKQEEKYFNAKKELAGNDLDTKRIY